MSTIFDLDYHSLVCFPASTPFLNSSRAFRPAYGGVGIVRMRHFCPFGLLLFSVDESMIGRQFFRELPVRSFSAIYFSLSRFLSTPWSVRLWSQLPSFLQILSFPPNLCFFFCNEPPTCQDTPIRFLPSTSLVMTCHHVPPSLGRREPKHFPPLHLIFPNRLILK